jgi:hypothetical protein
MDNSMKTYTLTEDQFEAIERGLVLAEYFVQEYQSCDHSGDMAEQCERDEQIFNDAMQVVYALKGF